VLSIQAKEGLTATLLDEAKLTSRLKELRFSKTAAGAA
jgi:hypothetical protein